MGTAGPEMKEPVQPIFAKNSSRMGTPLLDGCLDLVFLFITGLGPLVVFASASNSKRVVYWLIHLVVSPFSQLYSGNSGRSCVFLGRPSGSFK